MHVIEKELIKACDFKPRRKYSDRQDYLKALANEINKMEDSDYEDLSDEATDWNNAAVKAINSKQDLPDFDDEVEAEETEEDNEAAEAAEDVAAEDDAEEDDETEDGDIEEDAEEDETEENVKPKKPTKKGKPEKAEKTEKVAAKPKVTGKRTPAHMENVQLNRYGVVEESKAGQACEMFEKGATTREIKDRIGGTYYNLLKRLEADGHHIIKDGSVVKIIHKDDYGKKVKAGAPKPKAKAEPEDEDEEVEVKKPVKKTAKKK